MSFEELKSSGITTDTPKNIMLGAGTIHKGFALTYSLTTDTAIVKGKTYYTRSSDSAPYTYTAVEEPSLSSISTYYEAKWNFEESLIGATSGGSKFSIVPEFTDIEVDGALVKVKGLTVKTGEVATMEVNFIEMTPELLKMCVIGDSAASTDFAGYTEITSRARITEKDYVENLAYVGHKTDGTPIIIIFDQAICTSGLEVEGKNKEAGVFTGTFECVADISPEADTLPWRILYPTIAE
jgi:hypothetical protein